MSKERKLKSISEFGDALTPEQVYQCLPIGRNKVYQLLQEQVIKNRKVDNHRIIPTQSLLDFLDLSDYNGDTHE